jgi:hypothetical protein
MQESHQQATNRRGWLWAGMVGALLAVAANWPTVGGELIYDDHSIVEENPVVRGQQPWYAAWTMPYWPTPEGESPADILYRPITTLTLRWNCLAPTGSLPAWPYRATNLALHAAVTVLLAWLATRLWRRTLAGLIAAAWFAVLPVHADAIAPAVGRSEMLVALFGMAVLAHVALAPLQVDARRMTIGHVAVSIAFLAALFSKEHAVLLLPVTLLWSIWRQRAAGGVPSRRWGSNDTPRTAVRICFDRWARQCGLGLLAATAVFFFCRWLIFGQFMHLPIEALHPMANRLLLADWATRLLTPVAFVARYTAMILIPLRLNPIWGHPCPPLTHTPVDPWFWLGLALLTFGVLTAVWTWRRGSVGGPMIAGLLISMILPCHMLGHVSWLMAERWMYWPSLWWALLLAGLLAHYWPRARAWQVAIGIACAAAVGVLAASSWKYLTVWHDDEQLYRAAAARCPGSFYAQRNMAILLIRTGRPAEALPWANRLSKEYPKRFEGYQLTVRAYLAMGDEKQALQALEQWEQSPAEPPRVQYIREGQDASPPPSVPTTEAAEQQTE